MIRIKKNLIKLIAMVLLGIVNMSNTNIPPVGFVGGTIDNPSQAILPNTVPALITATAASGCTSFTYQWQQSPNGIYFANIPNATGANYQPPALSITTYYRRKAICSTGGIAFTTNIAKISTLDPGCINQNNANQTILINTAPTINASAASLGSCGGNYSYQWQVSTNIFNFVNIPGATSQNLTYNTPINQTTYFHRRVTCNGEVKYTNGATVYVSSIAYGNDAINGNYYSQNCASGQTAEPYAVSIPQGTYTAATQPAANQLAQEAAQNQANQYGICSGTATIYARLEVNFSYTGTTDEYNESFHAMEYHYYQQVALYVRFYSDEACTQPYTLTNNVNFAINRSGYYESESGYTDNPGSNYWSGTATTGANEIFLDDIISFEGLWYIYTTPEGNLLYYEKWRDDYELTSVSGNCVIRPPVYPAHSSGY